MAATEPIRDRKKLTELAEYFLERGELRNRLLLIMDTGTVLRISDLLRIRWADVYDFEHEKFRSFLYLVEKKTGKPKRIAICSNITEALEMYFPFRKGDFIFDNGRNENRPISRVQAWRILKRAVEAVGIEGKISCHSLRKTWGYFAWTEKKISPVVIMQVYNHSSFKVTQRYLGITQDAVDTAYLGMNLFG